MTEHNTTVDLIRALANARGLSLTNLEITLGLGNGTISRWNKSSPNSDKLVKVADFFHVSTDYLLCREEKEPADQTVNGLTKERQALIDLIMACPEERAKDLLTAMQLFLQNWQR